MRGEAAGDGSLVLGGAGAGIPGGPGGGLRVGGAGVPGATGGIGNRARRMAPGNSYRTLVSYRHSDFR